MSDELEVLAPLVNIPVETLVAPVEGEMPGVTQEEPRVEDVRAAEAYFTRQQQESRQVAGLVGMWAGTLLLHDLAAQHFEGREETAKTPRRLPNGRRPDDEAR